jgi:excisionase family DNA binding protein
MPSSRRTRERQTQAERTREINGETLPSRYLTPNDVAELLDVPLETVYQWRRKRTGPLGFRVGRHLRYHPADVRRWIDDLRDGAA